MKEVDARGLSCPEPVMLTMDALKEADTVRVLVSEPHQRKNIEKLAKSKKKTFESKEINGDYEIVIK